MAFDFIVIFYQPSVMIFPQFVIYVLIYDYLKCRKDPSITSKEIANCISVALAVALSVFIIVTMNVISLLDHNID